MIKLVIDIGDGLVPVLSDFLERRGFSQNLRGRVMAASTDACGPHLMGWHLGETIRKVNNFLERHRLAPPIPRPGLPWDKPRIQETLQFMLDNFNWQEGEVRDCGFEEQPEHWAGLVSDHPGIFGTTTVRPDEPEMLITYMVDVPAREAPHLKDFMGRRELPFNIRGNIVPARTEYSGDRTLRGEDAQEALDQINRRVRKGPLGREIPGPAHRWSIGHLQAFLDFALQNYDWQDGQIRRALHSETPERWAEIVPGQLPGLREEGTGQRQGE